MNASSLGVLETWQGVYGNGALRSGLIFLRSVRGLYWPISGAFGMEKCVYYLSASQERSVAWDAGTPEYQEGRCDGTPHGLTVAGPGMQLMLTTRGGVHTAANTRRNLVSYHRLDVIGNKLWSLWYC